MHVIQLHIGTSNSYNSLQEDVCLQAPAAQVIPFALTSKDTVEGLPERSSW